MPELTTKSIGMTQCPICHKLMHWTAPAPDDQRYCPRCGSVVRQRHYGSIAISWALILAALIFLIPANVFPIMTVIYFGEGELHARELE